MKYSVGIIIFVITTIFIADHECHIKILNIKIENHSPSYKFAKVMRQSVNQVSQNKKNLVIFWNLASDLPADIQLVSNVYEYDDNGNDERLMVQYIIPICYESEYRRFLPKFLKVPDYMLNKQCIPKNLYNFAIEPIEIEEMVPNLRQQTKYLTIESSISTANEVVLSWITWIEVLGSKPTTMEIVKSVSHTLPTVIEIETNTYVPPANTLSSPTQTYKPDPMFQAKADVILEADQGKC